MSEVARYFGTWWSVSTPDEAVGGVLTFSDDGQSKLELAGEIFDYNGSTTIVHGAADGKPVTILSPIIGNGGSITLGRFHTRTQVLESNCVIVGIHIETVDAPVFDSMTAEISNLTAWADSQSMLEVTRTFDRDEFKMLRTEAKIEPVKDLTVSVSNKDENVTLVWATRMSGGANQTNWSRGFSADESVRFRVSSEQPRSVREFWPTLSAMQDLLTLATQEPCSMGNLSLESKAQEVAKADYYFYNGRTDRSVSKGPDTILFGLKDIDFEAVFNAWIAIRDTIGLPLSVLFGLDYESGGFYENRIFNAASAAEGFHAAFLPDATSIPESLHQSILDKVKHMFDKNERAWLGPLVGNNRPGLKDRYLELAEIPDKSAVEQLVGNVEVWARWLKNARNAIGHLNTGELEKKVPDGGRTRLTYVTKALLHLVLMEKIGVSAEKQQDAVRDAWGYSSGRFKAAVKASEEL